MGVRKAWPGAEEGAGVEDLWGPQGLSRSQGKPPEPGLELGVGDSDPTRSWERLPEPGLRLGPGGGVLRPDQELGKAPRARARAGSWGWGTWTL